MLSADLVRALMIDAASSPTFLRYDVAQNEQIVKFKRGFYTTCRINTTIANKINDLRRFLNVLD